MKNAYALGRLLWRPMSIVLLFPVLLAVAMPIAWSPLALDVIPVAETQGLILLLWREVVILHVVGFLTAMFVRELKSGLFAWTLPGVDRYLLVGAFGVAMVFTLPLAIAFANFTGLSMAIAAMGGGILFFALGTELQDSLAPRSYRWALFTAVIVGLWKVEYLHQAASMSPILFSIVTGSIGAFLMHRASSAHASRRRPFAVDLAFGFVGAEGLKDYWSKRKGPEREWVKPLRNAGKMDWINAAYFESYNGRSGGWTRTLLFQVAYGALVTYQMNSPVFITLIAAMCFTYSGLQLRMNLLYPVSREVRARIFYLTSLLENVAVSSTLAFGIWLMYTIDPGRLNFGSDDRVYSAGTAASLVLIVVMLAPLAQWAKIQGPPSRSHGISQPRGWVRIFGFQILFGIVAVSISIPFLKWNVKPEQKWLMIAMSTVVLQGLYWVAVRYHFRRANLVLMRGMGAYSV